MVVNNSPGRVRANPDRARRREFDSPASTGQSHKKAKIKRTPIAARLSCFVGVLLLFSTDHAK